MLVQRYTDTLIPHRKRHYPFLYDKSKLGYKSTTLATGKVKIMLKNVSKDWSSGAPFFKPGQQKPEVTYANYRPKTSVEEQL